MGKNLSTKWIYEVVTRVGDLDAHAKITTRIYLLAVINLGISTDKEALVSAVLGEQVVSTNFSQR